MKNVIVYCLLLVTYYAVADVPGNKPRSNYNVKIIGLQQYNEYTFYVQDNDASSELKDSALIHIQGGFGAPQCVNVWAVHNKSEEHTDTLYFCSGDERESKMILVNINNNRLSFSVATTKRMKENTIPFSSVNNKNDNDQFNKNKNIMYLISLLSFAILIALVFFVWNKNKQSNLQKSI